MNNKICISYRYYSTNERLHCPWKIVDGRISMPWFPVCQIEVQDSFFVSVSETFLSQQQRAFSALMRLCAFRAPTFVIEKSFVTAEVMKTSQHYYHYLIQHSGGASPSFTYGRTLQFWHFALISHLEIGFCSANNSMSGGDDGRRASLIRKMFCNSDSVTRTKEWNPCWSSNKMPAILQWQLIQTCQQYYPY